VSAARSRPLRLAVRLAAVVLLGFLAFRLTQLWNRDPVDFSAANGWLLALASGLSLVAVVSYGLVWPHILRRIGTTPPRDALRIFLQSQLGKYVPGSVWQYAGRIGLARDRGIPARVTILSLAIEVGGSVIAAGAIAMFVLPVFVALPLAVAGLVGVVFIGSSTRVQRLFRPAIRLVARAVPSELVDMQVVYGRLPGITLLYIPVWLVYGLAFWLTGRALFSLPAHEVLFFAGAFAIGWLVGMAAVFAPGGIGVREAVLVALLAPRIGQREALVLAGASRLLLTAADLAGGGAALLLPRLGRGVAASSLKGIDGE